MSDATAKFKCNSVTKYEDYAEVSLSPVTSGSQENKKFFKYTPAGNIKMSICSFETAKSFEPGKFYYVNFTQADG